MADAKVASADGVVPLQPRHETGADAEARDGFVPRFLAPLLPAAPVPPHFAFPRPGPPAGAAGSAVSPSTLP